MKEYIDSDYIANSIRQDKSISETILLVEGQSDYDFYRKFLNTELVYIQISHGKENAVGALNILASVNEYEDRIFAVVDKDFDEILGIQLNDRCIYTDAHDVEMMCFKADTFNAFIDEYMSASKIETIEKRQGDSLRQILLNISEQIAHFRKISIINRYNLSFKAKANDREINFSKFIDKDRLEYQSHLELVRTVIRYKNQGVQYDENLIVGQIEESTIEGSDPYDYSNGHDIAKIIELGLKKCIGKTTTQRCSTPEIERALRLSYPLSEFIKTRMAQQIREINGDFVKPVV
ncbi:DUF4435 domain-containing protein [Lewinella sp. IMCC34191]|uniref:DUF4435 domain-containing protein n=1 Tax=Lewinella sp. IMCC34191 TaxID=2259172 RepID=UPI000E259378|nr:DUF4435 domain-containing protein [Lewinella sp. IMCC34191]